MKRYFYFLLVLTLALAFLAGCEAAPTETEPKDEPAEKEEPAEEEIVLSAAGFLDQDNLMSRYIFELDEYVQESTDGRISIEWTGGPEAIPGHEQPDAVREGVVDIAMVSASYYKDQEPIMSGMNLSPYSPTEEREKGIHDFFAEKHENVGLHYVGRGENNIEVPTYFWSKEKYDSPKDMEGEPFRSDPRVDMVLEALNLDPVIIDMTEVYPALERGVVVGGSHPTIIVTPMGLHEMYDYAYEPPFMYSATVLIMNPDTYNEMPEDLQEQFDEAVQKAEQEYLEQTFVEEYNKFMDPFLEEGGEIVEWTGEDADWYIETARGALWEEVEEEDPEATQELMELYGVEDDY